MTAGLPADRCSKTGEGGCKKRRDSVADFWSLRYPTHRVGPAMADYYYGLEGQQMGPIPDTALLDLWSGGALAQDTIVWTEGMNEWLPLWQVFPGRVPPLPPGVAPPADIRPAVAVPMARCAFSGQYRPMAEMVRFGDDLVAAEFRDRYLQRLMQGGEVAGPGSEPAGVARRFAGNVLDSLLLWGVTVAIAFGVGLFQGGNIFRLGLIFPVIVYVLSGVYEISMLATRGATVGKMATGARVVGPAGRKPTLAQAIIRWAVKALPGGIPNIGIFYGLGNIVAALADQPRLRALHDRAASTQVVKSR